MKRSKKFTRCVLTAVMVLAFLCGCGAEQPNRVVMEFDPKEQIVDQDGAMITFLGFKADSINLIAIEAALRDFMDVNPEIVVTYEGIKGQLYWEAFELRAESGELDDIFMIDHDQLLNLSGEGKLADLSDISSVGNYIPLAKSQFLQPDGAIYFLPTCISSYNLFINTDLLERNGQPVPTNLEEFSRVCDYFADRGITPVIANNYNSMRSLIVAKGMYPVYQAEGPAAEIEKFNRGEADLLKQLRPGLELVEEMAARGWLDGEEILTVNAQADDLALFSMGERPFMITGGWM